MELNRNTVIITILSIVTIFSLLFAVYSLSNTAPQKEQTNGAVVPEAQKLTSTDNTTWSKDNKILLVEYGDIQCPACRNFNDIIKGMEGSEADKDIVSKVTYVYRHYPLQQMHKNALGAAHIAQAAAEQGKFFEVVDALYDSQTDWESKNNPKFEDYLKDLKLDVKKLKADAASSKVKNIVTENIASGNRVGVNATPTFFLNGRKIQVSSIDDFKKQLRTAATAK